MPLKPGFSQEVVSSNIKELVRSGRKPKEAIAAALAEARKHKKMSEGGLVESQADSDDGSVNAGSDEQGAPGEATYPEHDDDQGLSPNVMSAQSLAKGLQAARYGANDNTNMYEADDSVAGSKMSSDGLEDEAGGMHSELGSKPSQDRAGGTEAAPMSAELSVDTLAAIRAKKMKRKFAA